MSTVLLKYVYCCFIVKHNDFYRCKENFGWSIAGTTKEDQLRWMAALLLAEHGVEGVLPPTTVNNLLDY